MPTQQIPFQSDHFTLHQLAEGGFAAIAKNGGAAVANAGIIDLGDRTLVYDTFLTPQAARDLLAAAQQVTSREPELIVNSHYHNDHIWGNQVFSPRANIISTTQTWHLIQTEGKEEIEWGNKSSVARLEQARKQYDSAEDERSRQDALLWVGYWQSLIDNMPNLQVRLPDITFEDKLTIRGSTRTVELIPFEGTHTGSDAILYLPEEQIVFATDLLFVNCHPFLAEGDVHKLKQALNELSSMKAETYVPGHGPLGTMEDIQSNIKYISTCLDFANKLTDDQTAPMDIPDEFSSWELSNFFWINVEALTSKLQK
ncbi:MAG TPA: MBL fold metallo-hydrolase [Anaerolineales bacterium]|nr:MBL fold metallo-hydrolase [Anaerolineales bacterium]